MKRRGMLGAAAMSWPLGAAAADAASPGRTAPRPAGAILPEGAIADGANHPLSTMFATLAEARRVFPHATALEDEIDWCALQGAINAAQRQGGGAVHVPNGGRGYVLNRGLVLDPNAVTLRGDGSLLDFRALPAGGRAVWFRAEPNRPYGHERHVFEGFELRGPGQDAADRAALLFRAEAPGASSRAMVRDCAVHGFHDAVMFGHRAYLVHFDHCVFHDCRFCVNCPYGLQDAGETVSFSQCTLGNSYCLIANMAGFDLKFVSCSLDYAGRVVWDNNGIIDLVGCRVELAPPSEPPFHCNHGRINMFGGFILVTDPQNRGPFPPAMFAFNNPQASVHLLAVQGWNWRTRSGRLAAGPGKVHWYAGEVVDSPDIVGDP